MLPSPFTYFDRIYCINLDSRPDRWEAMQQQFAQQGIKNVIRVSGIEVAENKFVSFNLSQRFSLIKAGDATRKTFFLPQQKNALILEDDCVFKNTTHLHYAMNELPPDWDILYLGANILGSDITPFKKPIRFSSHLFRLTDAWQTHAMVYNSKLLEKIINSFDPYGGIIYDEWLRTTIIPQGNCYIIAPQIAYQAPGYSDLWHTQADYTSLFDRGNELLK